MIRPTLEDIKPLLNFNVIEFQNWLLNGLEGKLHENKDIWAFEHIGLFMGQDEHLALDLQNIYDAMPAVNRGIFRQALANLIATLECLEENVDIFNMLLHLAGLVSAGSEIFPILPTRVGNGFFGMSNNREGESIFGTTMMTVANLASPTKEAKKCLLALIGSNYFELAYSGLALVSLCRVDGANLADHLKLLRDPLLSMFEKYKVNDVAKRRLAESVLNTIGLFNLKEGLNNISISDPARFWLSSDNWFLVALTDASITGRPLIGTTAHNNVISIFTPDKPEIKFELEDNQPKKQYEISPSCFNVKTEILQISTDADLLITDTLSRYDNLFCFTSNPYMNSTGSNLKVHNHE